MGASWKPAAPVRLYAGAKDTDVPIGNARTCARTLAGEGARVRVLNQGDVDHVGSYVAVLPRIVRWFGGGTAQYQPLACQKFQASAGLP